MKKKIFYFLSMIIFSIFLFSCNTVNINPTPTNQTPSKDNENPSDKTPSKDSETPEKPTINPKPSVSTKNYRIFLFDTEDLKLYYIDKELSVTDNALVTSLTTELQNNNTSDSLLKLTNKVGVTSAKLDNDTGILTIKFDDSYVKNMLLGTATESGLLSSLVNTYGYNYNVDKVSIYFGDQLYTGLKGDLPEGYFKTNFAEAVDFTLKNSTTIDKEKTCRLYFYDGADDCFYYTDSLLKVTDNALVTALTTALKKTPKSSLFAIPDNISVINATLNSEKGILTVNLSKSYYDILSKVGSGSEASVLQALAMTYGYNYNIDKVIILIDGNPYTGSHFSLSDGEFVKFNLSDAKKLQ